MNDRGIYAAHRLYEGSRLIAKNMVIECAEGRIETICPFELEKHSMQWYDAIVLSKADCRQRIFRSMEDFFVFLDSADVYDRVCAYGINTEKEVCIVSILSEE